MKTTASTTSGDGEKCDRADVDGDAREHVSVRFMGGDALAVATIFRDEQSLDAETQMERRS